MLKGPSRWPASSCATSARAARCARSIRTSFRGPWRNWIVAFGDITPTGVVDAFQRCTDCVLSRITFHSTDKTVLFFWKVLGGLPCPHACRLVFSKRIAQMGKRGYFGNSVSRGYFSSEAFISKRAFQLGFTSEPGVTSLGCDLYTAASVIESACACSHSVSKYCNSSCTLLAVQIL